MDDYPFAKELKGSLSVKIKLLQSKMAEAHARWNLVRTELSRLSSASEVYFTVIHIDACCLEVHSAPTSASISWPPHSPHHHCPASNLKTIHRSNFGLLPPLTLIFSLTYPPPFLIVTVPLFLFMYLIRGYLTLLHSVKKISVPCLTVHLRPSMWTRKWSSVWVTWELELQN